MSYVDEDKVKEVSKSHLTDNLRRTAFGWNEEEYSSAMQLRNAFIAPYTVVFNNIANKYNLHQLNVLEIGAGKIQHVMGKNSPESFLSGIIPYQSWKFSDIYSPSSKGILNKQYIQFDLLNSSAKIDTKFNCVVGCNVLDTLPYDMLVTAFENISKVIKPGDVCIHFADQNFFGNIFFDALAKDSTDCVYLPANEQLNSVYKIDRSDFLQLLKEKSHVLSSQEISLFKYWVMQKRLLQVFSTWKFVSNEIQGSENLIDRINEIFSSKLETISSQEVFPQKLQEAAEINGFTVEVCSDAHATVVVELTKNENMNYGLSNQKFSLAFRCYVLKPNIKLLNVQAHIFVARNK
ncbi:MAG: hypothetical protein H0U49_09920 [Parachlamydiaceae bacterium]|nr:hypothetical protein [Parachlamydiaceae bacterium]